MKSNSKETNRVQEPSKFAIKFANMVFVLGILFTVLISMYAVYLIYNKPENLTSIFYFSYLLFAILTAILFVFGLWTLSDELKVNLSVMFVTVGIVVYGFETYLEFPHEEPQSRKEIAEEMGVLFDTRTKIEVIDDLNDSGVKSYPNVFPFLFISTNGLTAKKGRIFPLGGISNITTIFSNELGYYPILKTDEHGFNNPKGLYKINKVDIMLIGDSFVEGYSVNSDENMGAILRESGFNAISIGKGSNGSLIELAELKEYAEPLKPKVVLWIYYVNDLDELGYELQSSILKNYLNEEDYSQNLISRQEEIDSLWVDYVEVVKKRERIIDFILLTNLRSRINLSTTLSSTPTPTPTPTPIFKDILQKSKQMVQRWGGKMYFVYLASFTHYETGIEHVDREFVLHTATELDIPIIDIHREAFDPHPDPFSLFPFRIDGHYNAEGYRLVAETISKRLKADGIIPLNSKN